MVLDKPLESVDGPFTPGLSGVTLQHSLGGGDASPWSGLRPWQWLKPSIEILLFFGYGVLGLLMDIEHSPDAQREKFPNLDAEWRLTNEILISAKRGPRPPHPPTVELSDRHVYRDKVVNYFVEKMVLDKPLESVDGPFTPGLSGVTLQHSLGGGDASPWSGLRPWQWLKPSIEILLFFGLV
ncbi:hypothetical protein Ancab_000834 [Ancistrocladus abbreviatus]